MSSTISGDVPPEAKPIRNFWYPAHSRASDHARQAIQGRVDRQQASVGGRRDRPSENGYEKGPIGKLRDELLNGEISCTEGEARVLIERWREH